MFSSCSVHLFDPKRFWTLSKVKRAFSTDLTRAALLRCNRARTGHPAHRVFCDPIRHGTPRSLRPARRADRSDEDMHRASVPYPSRHIWRPGRRGSDSRKLSVLEPPSRRPPRRRRRLCRRHLIPPTKSPPLRRAQKWRKIQCTRWPARQSAPSRRPTRPPIVA